MYNCGDINASIRHYRTPKFKKNFFKFEFMQI